MKWRRAIFLLLCFFGFSVMFCFRVLFDAFGNGNTMSGRHSFGFDFCLLFLTFYPFDFPVS